MQGQFTKFTQCFGNGVNWAIVVITLLCFSGCVIGGRDLYDEPIGSERVAKISPGNTSIMEIMTRLGPPTIIVRHGQNTAFFELFSLVRTINEGEAVYYYQASRKTRSGFIVVLILFNFGGVTHRVQADRLWLLVDERTGLIEGYVYRDAGDDEYLMSMASELERR